MNKHYHIEARIGYETIPLTNNGFKFSNNLTGDYKVYNHLSDARKAYRNINKKFLKEDGFDCYEVEILLIENKIHIINRKTIKI
jgi:hypothetical protein